jgi:ribulose-5-phosphate 4-epimerase/fuculose-1-phosphate aldolase
MPIPSQSSPGVTRRDFLRAWSFAATSALLGRAGAAQADAPASAGPVDAALIEDLVAANHILASEGVVDGYGHVSVRHPRSAARLLIARSMAPELVSAEDILELDLEGNAIDLRGRKLYLERFIHGEIYRARADVQSVVHHHSPAVLPFAVTQVPLRPIYHMAAFVGQGVPVFEIRDAGGATDMLISNAQLGRALAKTLGDKPAALMRGHGAVVVGRSIMEAVARSVYLQMNARLQAQAMALGGEVTYLNAEEVAKLASPNWYDRAWELWKRKALAK